MSDAKKTSQEDETVADAILKVGLLAWLVGTGGRVKDSPRRSFDEHIEEARKKV